MRIFAHVLCAETEIVYIEDAVIENHENLYTAQGSKAFSSYNLRNLYFSDLDITDDNRSPTITIKPHQTDLTKYSVRVGVGHLYRTVTNLGFQVGN